MQPFFLLESFTFKFKREAFIIGFKT